MAREEIDQILSRLTKVEAFLDPHQSLIGNMTDRIDSLNAHINQQVAELFDKVASNCKEFELHLSTSAIEMVKQMEGINSVNHDLSERFTDLDIEF